MGRGQDPERDRHRGSASLLLQGDQADGAQGRQGSPGEKELSGSSTTMSHC